VIKNPVLYLDDEITCILSIFSPNCDAIGRKVLVHVQRFEYVHLRGSTFPLPQSLLTGQSTLAVCVCLYACMCVCMHVHCMCMCVCMSRSGCVHVHVRVCVYTF
jgi:hypothetical protein